MDLPLRGRPHRRADRRDPRRAAFAARPRPPRPECAGLGSRGDRPSECLPQCDGSPPQGPQAMTTDAVTLTVVVLTYRRPDELLRALPAIVEQIDGVNAGDGRVTADILVVDNDALASARQA